jgi:hypothetical protein
MIITDDLRSLTVDRQMPIAIAEHRTLNASVERAVLGAVNKTVIQGSRCRRAPHCTSRGCGILKRMASGFAARREPLPSSSPRHRRARAGGARARRSSWLRVACAMCLCVSAARAGSATPATAIAPPRFAPPSTPIATSFDRVVRAELVGNPLDGYPYFEYSRVFNEGVTMSFAVDPARYPELAGAHGYLFIVAHKTPEQWAADPTLVDVRFAAQTVGIVGEDVPSNTFPVLFGPIAGDAGIGFGVGYDAVLDLNWNGVLDEGDAIQGLSVEPGFWVVSPPEALGPHPYVEVNYTGGTFLGEDTFFPRDIATMGALPLVVISHGNGHNYHWYDHIGKHLASHGYVVMSHQNNTGPGIETASTTTLTNTEYILAHQDTIASGALNGHIDSHHIIFIGHSRGGEGVVRAYDRLVTGNWTSPYFGASDIVLISSMAPTDFLGPSQSNPHAVPYHVWVGGADDDVNGCADCDLCQSFHFYSRAQGFRQSTSLHGVGHGAFHNGPGQSIVATGPCLLTREQTHRILKGYFLALIEHYVHGNVPAKDYLWRQWEDFQPIGASTGPCVHVDLQYKDASSEGNFVIDDFQSQPATSVSSSGGAVLYNVDDLVEGLFHDGDATFTSVSSDPMNGMTQDGPNDGERGLVFDWNGADRRLAFEIDAAHRDLRTSAYLSFRACQMTRHPLTIAELGNLTFSVTLRDGDGGESTIDIGAYHGGIEEPYQRTACGSGAGWGNEFETIRIRLADFMRATAAFDLHDVEWIELRFGPSFGSPQGRIGFDDLEITAR